jgi:hypothetical protein
LLPIYRAVSGYPEVLEEGISGNPETRSCEALHEQAWQLVGPRFNARRSEGRERFYAMASQGKSSNRLAEVVLAAVVSEDHQPWGAAFHTAKSPPSSPDETLPVDN